MQRVQAAVYTCEYKRINIVVGASNTQPTRVFLHTGHLTIYQLQSIGINSQTLERRAFAKKIVFNCESYKLTLEKKLLMYISCKHQTQRHSLNQSYFNVYIYIQVHEV